LVNHRVKYTVVAFCPTKKTTFVDVVIFDPIGAVFGFYSEHKVII
jgi:hypothetical protein